MLSNVLWHFVKKHNIGNKQLGEVKYIDLSKFQIDSVYIDLSFPWFQDKFYAFPEIWRRQIVKIHLIKSAKVYQLWYINY